MSTEGSFRPSRISASRAKRIRSDATSNASATMAAAARAPAIPPSRAPADRRSMTVPGPGLRTASPRGSRTRRRTSAPPPIWMNPRARSRSTRSVGRYEPRAAATGTVRAARERNNSTTAFEPLVERVPGRRASGIAPDRASERVRIDRVEQPEGIAQVDQPATRSEAMDVGLVDLETAQQPVVDPVPWRTGRWIPAGHR